MSVFEESRSYRPFKYPWAVEAARKHSIDMFWDVHQVELQDDLRQYNAPGGLATTNVSHEVTKAIVDKILCLFTEMDKTVGDGYKKLIPYIKNNECSNLLLTQAAREVTHQRAYALLAETFGFQENDWIAFSEYVEMQDKIDLMSKDEDLSTNLGRAKLLGRILLGEGIGLFSAFACFLNLKRHGLFVGFNDVNQWSLIDENDHILNNMKILEEIRKDLSEAENFELDRCLGEMIDSYVEAEDRFVDLVFEIGDQEDLTKDQLKDYNGFLGELRKFQLGLIYLAEVRENPLEWMEWLLAASKHDNFFEKKVTEYVHNKLAGGVDYSVYQQRV